MGLCISLSNKLCPATLDDETPSAVAPNSTSTTATTVPPVPPVPQRVERTDATGALIKPGNFSQKTSLHQSTRIGFMHLPMELVQHIAREVASGSPRDTAGGVRALMLSNTYLNKAVSNEKSVQKHYLFLKQLMPHFNNLIARIPIHELTSHTLALIGPKQLQARVTAALGLANEGYKARAIAGLGAGLAALDAPQQQALVTAALGLTDEGCKAAAIAGLGAGLAALDAPQQQALVTAALGLTGEGCKADAIAGLINGYQDSRVRDYRS